jgi:hypothetical protein
LTASDSNFAAAAAVFSDSDDNITEAAIRRLPTADASIGEALATLLIAHLAASRGCNSLIVEGDAHAIILAINRPSLFTD